MGVCACQSKKSTPIFVEPPSPLRMGTTDVHVKEKENRQETDLNQHNDNDFNFELMNKVNFPSVTPTFQQGGGRNGAGSGSRESKDGSGGHHPYTDGNSYRVGQPLYQRNKVKVYQCMQSSGKFLTMKYIYVEEL